MTKDGTLTRALIAYLLLAGLIATCAFVLGTDRAMSPVWYGPYLSAAGNVEWGGQFRFNIEETKAFSELAPPERLEYRFSATGNFVPYNANPVAYAHFIAIAKSLFFWLPDVPALESLQILLHTLLSLAVLALLPSRATKVLFLLLYAVNPVVLYYVTFPYYYFLQAIPSFALAVLLLKAPTGPITSSGWWGLALLGVSAILGLVLLVRPTTVLAIAAFFALAVLRVRPRGWVAASIAIFLGIVISGHSPSQKNFWHTAYVGIGAYPNPYMESLSDNNGYALYEARTGTELNASLGGNYYDRATMDRYIELTRSEYMTILESDWPRLIRNAAVNTLQGFSTGYMAGAPPLVNYAIAASGLVVLALLLATGQWLLVVLIGATIGSFSPYFPPIPAYMYGAYLLLVLGAIHIVERTGVLRLLPSSLNVAPHAPTNRPIYKS